MSQVGSFFLLADIPIIKGSLWRVGMEKGPFCNLKGCAGPLEERWASRSCLGWEGQGTAGWGQRVLFPPFQFSVLLRLLSDPESVCPSFHISLLASAPLTYLSSPISQQPACRPPLASRLLRSWPSGRHPPALTVRIGRGGDGGDKGDFLVTSSFPFPGLKPSSAH